MGTNRISKEWSELTAAAKRLKSLRVVGPWTHKNDHKTLVVGGEPTVIVEPPRVLRAMLSGGHVDLIEGDRLVLTNDHGKLAITLESGRQRLPVVEAEPTVFAWFTLQVAATWGREPLIIKGEEG